MFYHIHGGRLLCCLVNHNNPYRNSGQDLYLMKDGRFLFYENIATNSIGHANIELFKFNSRRYLIQVLKKSPFWLSDKKRVIIDEDR